MTFFVYARDEEAKDEKKYTLHTGLCKIHI